LKVLLALLSVSLGAQAAAPPAAPGLISSQFIFDTAPFASAHASTIAETPTGLVAAWFAGTRESAPDVAIWSSRQIDGVWTPPTEVANGVQRDGRRFACWNPVLFRASDGVLRLFYKVGPSPREWWGLVRQSRDDGRTWSEARRLPEGILGPIKNKPVQLASGLLISPSSTEGPLGSEPPQWRVHFELSADLGLTWTRVAPPASDRIINAIQPSVLRYSDGRLQAVGRTQSGSIFESWSSDNGSSWSALTLTSLPNPNAGIDAVTLRDGRQLIVYNHTTSGRTPLNVAVSRDGSLWEAALVLETQPGEYSYPAVIQTKDGLVHITYTWQRTRIRHVVVNPAQLSPAPMVNGRWPDR
jgi:predicted neuraminidase